jgi:hypothetical protein
LAEEGDLSKLLGIPFGLNLTLEESLSITTGRCDLAIATHAREMHKKNINMIVQFVDVVFVSQK